MKYIRTKDGIFKIIIDDLGWEILVEADNDFGEKYIQEDNVLKQADTIEELCDEFVLVCETIAPSKSIISTYELAKHNFKSLTEDKVNFAIYGAIWTDKGLIYVAMINEEGELELL